MSINPFEDDSLALPGEHEAAPEAEVYQDEFLDEQDPQPQLEEASDEVDAHLSSAMKRIEQAQLYKTLLTHSVFAAGSARPEIQKAVEKEIRDFATERLEVLVGVRPEPSRQQAQAVGQFSEEEVGLLKSLVARLQQKSTASKEPNPQINPLAATPASKPIQVQPKVNQVAPARQVTKPAGKAPAAKPARRRSQSVSKSNPAKDYSQVSSPKALPMPTSIQMASKAAAEVHANHSRAMGSEKGQLINILTQMSVAKNQNVVEE